MKTLKIFFVIILLLSAHSVLGQQPKDKWEKWSFLIGDWVGEHSGKPGQGEGKFSFYKDLDGNVLVRKSRTEFPATSTRAAFVHDDLLYVYQGGTDSEEAIYFDNEGHTIKYKVAFTNSSIILTSDIIPNTPRFRFTYTEIDQKTVNASFEMASPKTPEDFKMYLEGKAFKK